MTHARAFALVCWLLWSALLIGGVWGLMPAPLAGGIAISIYALWRLYRRETLVTPVA
jgi:hypothetical protein